jgi:hypothetical protein
MAVAFRCAARKVYGRALKRPQAVYPAFVSRAVLAVEEEPRRLLRPRLQIRGEMPPTTSCRLFHSGASDPPRTNKAYVYSNLDPPRTNKAYVLLIELRCLKLYIVCQKRMHNPIFFPASIILLPAKNPLEARSLVAPIIIWTLRGCLILVTRGD